MNKAFCKKDFWFSLILTGCLILFNVSCGLDIFYVIDEPYNTEHIPEVDSTDYTDSYFEFWTVDKGYDGVTFLGTEVYYKIYRSSSALNSQVNILNNLAGSSETSSSAASRLIESYHYQPLRGQSLDGKMYEDVSVLIPSVKRNQKVYIRLSDYTDIDTYLARIKVDGENIYGDSSLVIPVRKITSHPDPSFNFANISSDYLPKDDDVDVNKDGTVEEGVLYVSLYAVAVAQDNTYSPVYSNILYLGAVQIPLK